ncbi:vanZ-like protein [Clostridium sp. CAG:609]|jgi:vanZ family protein|nr:vanZ-like protein [Clostridium sp. CAG:609]
MFLNTIKNVLNSNWPVLVIFIVTMVSMRFFYLRAHREKVYFYKEFFGILSIVYIFLLFQLLTKVELNTNSGYNLVPFTEIFRYKFGSSLFMYNVVGNILAFVIFGLIVSSYIKPKTCLAPFLTSLVVSTTVEFVQLNIGRSFDVDDIILNVLGGIIGYLLYIGLTAIHNHLPKVLQKEGIINIFCFIILIIMVLYVLKVMGVLAI